MTTSQVRMLVICQGTFNMSRSTNSESCIQIRTQVFSQLTLHFIFWVLMRLFTVFIIRQIPKVHKVLDQCFGHRKQSFVVMDTQLEILFFELKLLTLEK